MGSDHLGNYFYFKTMNGEFFKSGDKAMCMVDKDYFQTPSNIQEAYKLPDYGEIVCIESAIITSQGEPLITLVGFPLFYNDGSKAYFKSDVFMKIYPKGIKY